MITYLFSTISIGIPGYRGRNNNKNNKYIININCYIINDIIYR